MATAGSFPAWTFGVRIVPFPRLRHNELQAGHIPHPGDGLNPEKRCQLNWSMQHQLIG